MASNSNNTSRRQILRGGITAIAAAVAGLALGREKADAHGELHIEGSPAIHAVSTGSVAVEIKGIDEGALYAETTQGVAVVGTSSRGTGIIGFGRYEGVIGTGRDSAGIRGLSDIVGVHGKGNHFGVFGQLDRGSSLEPNGDAGVYGLAAGQLQVGIIAENRTDGFAFEARGRSLFQTGGSGMIPATVASVFVENSVVTRNSHITVTLTGKPGPGNQPVAVQWVERRPGMGFVVNLTNAVKQATPFTYLIVEHMVPPEWLE